mmetsp:Transcript_26252/g.51765  ORF Transcript_26252/g.51765 Transcript_26252/m.51765 type:complete len:116 (-) Transcript_26252:65-412(-)
MTAIVRLRHLYDYEESNIFSVPCTVELLGLFAASSMCQPVVAEERTVSLMRPANFTRFPWKIDPAASSEVSAVLKSTSGGIMPSLSQHSTSRSTDPLSVNLNPLDTNTFFVSFEC